MPTRYADSLKVFNKEFVFSYPDDLEEIQHIFSQLANGNINESDVAAITRVGYLPSAKNAFKRKFTGKIPSNDASWIEEWTPKEAEYLSSHSEQSVEEDNQFDLLQKSLDEKDEKIALLLEEIQQRNSQLDKLGQHLKQYQIEIEEDSATTLEALNDAKDTLKTTQQRNFALSDQIKSQKHTIEQQEQNVSKLVSNLEDLTKLVSTLRQEIISLKAENKHASKFFDENTAELAKEHRAAINTLEQKIRELNAQIELYTDQHAAELLTQKNQLESQILKLQQEKGLLRENLDDIQELLEARESNLSQAQLLITELDAQMQQALLDKQSALEAANNLQEELAISTESLQTLQGAYAQLEVRKDHLEEDNAKLQKQIQTFETAVLAKDSELKTAQQKNEKLTENLASAKIHIASLQNEMAALTETYEQRIQKLHADLSGEQDINAVLRQQIEAANTEKQRAEEQTEAVRGKVESTLEKLQLAEITRESLQFKLEQSLAQNVELLKQLEEARVRPKSTSDSESGYDSTTTSPKEREEVQELHEELENADAINPIISTHRDEPAPVIPVSVASIANTTVIREVAPPAAIPRRAEDTAPRPIPRRQQNIDSSAVWNAFLQHGGVMEKYFHDQLVKKGKEPALERWEEDELSLMASGENTPTFELVEIRKGDFIHSTAQFDKEGGAPGEKVVGKLVQDHTGRVINKTKDLLSEKQQCILALRQAEMILNNYTPTGKKGEGIIIEGNASNTLSGQRLIAALLLLKDQPGYHHKLKDMKIISTVPGCKVPEPVNGAFSFIKGKQTQEEANRKFINEFLPADKIIDPIITTRIKQQVGDFVAVKAISQERVKAMKEMLQHGREVEGVQVELSDEEKAIVQQRIADETLLPGDKIDLEGTKTPGPRRN